MYGTITKQIKEVLAEGPSTVVEIAITIGVDQRHANANIRSLWQRAILTRRPFYGDNQHRDRVWLYALPEHMANSA